MNKKLTRKEYENLIEEARHLGASSTDNLIYSLFLALQTTTIEYDIEHDSVLYDLMNSLDGILQAAEEYEYQDDRKFYDWVHERQEEEG